MFHSNVNAHGSREQQKENKAAENQTALAETTHSPPIRRRWWLQPGTHFSLVNLVSAAALNFW